jgi:ectoine hydroxylase-related dioxygenase (phytanoyl-CoA dioxygenase family)
MTIELLYPRPELRVATARERDAFHRDGYLVLPGVLDGAEVDRLTRAVDRIFRRENLDSADPDPGRRMDFMPVLEEGREFVELIDHERTFGYVLDLLGPYIQFGLSTVTVHPPNPVFKGFLHVDGGPAMQRIRPSETSWPLQVKIIWFLTDVDRPDMGNIVFVPGSHLRPFPEEGGQDEFGELPAAATPGTTQVMARAGDALIFTHALWHGGAVNRSGVTRKNIQYGYNQMFFRNYDYGEHVPESVLADASPRQRRLLGDMGPGGKPSHSFYPPRDHLRLMYGD